MTFSLSFVLVILAVLVWIIVLARRPRPIAPDIWDVFVFIALAFYFRGT